jgi:hypothetical protein
VQLLTLLLLLLALALLQQLLLLCCLRQLHKALRQQQLPGELLHPVGWLAGMQACLLKLLSPSNSRCWLGPGAQPVCIA